MANEKARASGKEEIALIWESEAIRKPDGSVSLVAVTPLSQVTRKQAAEVLGCSESTVMDLFRLGHLKAYKPGGWRKRKDGKATNAALRLDAGSVLRYRAAQQLAAKEWQDAQ